MNSSRIRSDNLQSENRKTPRIFLHLTKTAGGTLKSAIGKTPGLSTYFVYGSDDVENFRNVSPNTFDLIYGHSIFGLHQRIGLHEDTRYICFMRHPIMRTISHYYHLRNVDFGPIGDRIRESNDINDFFANHRHWEFSNFMMKVISGVGNSTPPEDVNIFRRAVEILDTRFDFVGFQEFFPISVRALGEYLGHKIDIDRDINIGRYNLGDVYPETIARIEILNQQDLRLYKFALRKFL